jgi:hypothetical protein
MLYYFLRNTDFSDEIYFSLLFSKLVALVQMMLNLEWTRIRPTLGSNLVLKIVGMA